MKNIIAYCLFPVVLTASIFSAILAFGLGYDPLYIIAFINVIAGIIVIIFERVLPFSKKWSQNHQDVQTDTLHLIFSSTSMPELFKVFAYSMLFGLASKIKTDFHFNLWPSESPLWLQMVLALVIAEFFQYWIHRIGHEKEFLWRFHATHHSVERLYWLNAGRFHPIESILQYGGQIIPVILLGGSPEVLALFALFTGVHGLFQHCNIDIKLGPLNWIFSNAELHRFHHSKDLSEANNNYGANLIIWDIIFGTRYLPKEKIPNVNIGLLDMPKFPKGYLGQVASPFTWRKLKS